jgi:hypothetical protein
MKRSIAKVNVGQNTTLQFSILGKSMHIMRNKKARRVDRRVRE